MSSNPIMPPCPGNDGGSHSWYFSTGRTMRVRPPTEVFVCNYCTLRKQVTRHNVRISTHEPRARPTHLFGAE